MTGAGLKIAAAFFAAYEAYKLLHAGEFSALIGQMKAAGRGEVSPETLMQSVFFRRVAFIELAYLLFAVFLLFTAYWYFTLALIGASAVVMMMETGSRAARLAMATASAVLAALLMHIVLA